MTEPGSDRTQPLPVPPTPWAHPQQPAPAGTEQPVPAPRRRTPLAVTAVAATALMAAGAVGVGAVVVTTADDLVAALAPLPALGADGDTATDGSADGSPDDSSDSTDGSSDDPGTTDATGASAAADGVDWGEVAEQVQPSVVAITVQSADGSGGQGSGVVLDEAGHVLTNNHVVATSSGGVEVSVTLVDGRVLAADVVGLDPSTDLAVLQVLDAPDDLVPVELGSSDDVQVGDPVMAVGNPLGLAGTVTTGIVSALDRPVTTQSVGVSSGEPVVTDAVQTDAAVNPGNSGGALVDAQGRLVGINSSIAGLGSGAGGQSGSIGLGFAIPVDSAAAVAEQLIEDGTAEHARLGVYLDDATAEVVDGPWAGERLGAGLAQVEPGSAAAQAGLQAGDVVVAVEGRPTTSAVSLTARVRALQPGQTVDVVVERDGEALEVPVTVEAAEA
ncbi:S1C family serine protease [Aquipuribacter hungaricus]|uniref:S1C family serine protease n=1 Tax=Aquipuribacter hungaricus TaxID=545624 RepID=A0ABV7WB36_9MICO